MTDRKDEHGEEQTRFLDFFDSWRLALGVAFIAIVLLTIWSFKLWSDLNETVDRLDTVVTQRLKEAKAADQETVARCFSSATQGPVLRRVLRALEEETMNAEAREDLKEFRRLSELNTPTIVECRQLAKKLRVTPTQGAEG